MANERKKQLNTFFSNMRQAESFLIASSRMLEWLTFQLNVILSKFYLVFVISMDVALHTVILSLKIFSWTIMTTSRFLTLDYRQFSDIEAMSDCWTKNVELSRTLGLKFSQGHTLHNQQTFGHSESYWSLCSLVNCHGTFH